MNRIVLSGIEYVCVYGVYRLHLYRTLKEQEAINKETLAVITRKIQ